MMDSEVTFVTDVDESVVALPAVGMNEALISHSSLDERFQSLLGAIIEDICVNG